MEMTSVQRENQIRDLACDGRLKRSVAAAMASRDAMAVRIRSAVK
jgi:hypothetical protein